MTVTMFLNESGLHISQEMPYCFVRRYWSIMVLKEARNVIILGDLPQDIPRKVLAYRSMARLTLQQVHHFKESKRFLFSIPIVSSIALVYINVSWW